jgi:hypothetical protein
MTTARQIEDRVGGRRILPPSTGWVLAAGGALFFVGGMLHPKDDPPGLTLKELLRLMYDDPAWYPAHVFLLAGTALIAEALAALARRRSLADVPAAQAAVTVAAAAAVLAATGMVLHLAAATDADRIAAHQSTPLTDVHIVVETITVPLFGLAIAVLAVIGATTGTLGNWLTALFGVVGGGAYALAGATAAFTDALDPLFPFASVIAFWATGTGVWVLRRGRATDPLPAPAPVV